MITTFASDLVALYRKTAYIVDAEEISASPSVDRQPVRKSIVSVEVYHVSGSDSGSGTVTISGTVDGSADSEVLSLSIGESADTVKLFTAVSSIATSGFSVSPAPYIRVQALGRGGEVQEQNYSVVSDWPAQIDRSSQRWTGGVEGLGVVAKPKVLIDYAETFTPRIGDIVKTESSEEFIVRGVVEQRSGYRPLHWELSVDRRGSSL